jgi:hypothetical protein
MKRAALAALALIGAAGLAHAQNLSADDIGRRTVERRAVEAVIWGMPAYQAMVRQTQGAWNQIVYWSRLLEKPDPHAESRRDLPHALLQHEGCRSSGARDSARRRDAGVDGEGGPLARLGRTAKRRTGGPLVEVERTCPLRVRQAPSTMSRHCVYGTGNSPLGRSAYRAYRIRVRA